MFHRAIMKKALGDKKTAKKFKFGIKLTRALRKIGIDKRRKIFRDPRQFWRASTHVDLRRCRYRPSDSCRYAEHISMLRVTVGLARTDSSFEPRCV